MIGYDIYSSAGLSIFTYWISRLLVFSVNYLPIKELFFSLHSLQYLFSPAFMYNGLEDYTRYKMIVPVEHYFSFAIPVLIIFSLGFRVFFNPNSLKVSRYKIDLWINSNPNIPYYFIVIGFIAPIFYFILPKSLNFVVYIADSLKFIGLFILISSSSKPKIGLILFTFSGVFISAFSAGMFHDLLTWIIMLGLIINYRYNPTFLLKMSGVMAFVIFAMFIQFVKDDLRSRIWGDQGEEISIDLIKTTSASAEGNKGGFFALESLGPSVNRLNQGWVLSSALNHVPHNIDHSNGLLIKEYLIAAIMPRFLFPDKLGGGETKYFDLYSGHNAGENTVMVLGIPTEAYIEFAGLGAFFYIFIFGMVYGWFLKVYAENSDNYPILSIFTILVFIYPMRPDCDTQTSLGHLVKSSILLYLFINFYKSKFNISFLRKAHAI
jgi:hypothetical protein